MSLLDILRDGHDLVLELDGVFIGRNWSLTEEDDDDEDEDFVPYFDAAYVDDDDYEKKEWRFLASELAEANLVNGEWVITNNKGYQTCMKVYEAVPVEVQRFSVDIQETREFTFHVEAESAEEAEEKASGLFDEDAEKHAVNIEHFDKRLTNLEPM